MKLTALWMLLGLMAVPALAEQVVLEQRQSALAADVFAVVDGKVITQQTFDTFLHVGKRQRFYHGDIPEAEEAAFRKEVAQRLIDQVLMRSAVKERGVVAEPEQVKVQLAAIEARYESRPHWRAQREGFLAELLPQVEEQSQFEQLETQVRNVVEVSETAVVAYYQANSEQFTTPERLRVSLILLGVEPWAQAAQWQAAMDEGERLIKRLRQGGDFAEMARLHSSDGSGLKGGDLGYVHKGMLAEEAQQVLDKMMPGEVSSAIRLLKGVAIFRVDERVSPVLNLFERVAPRARDLYVREQSEKNWREFMSEMRSSADVQVRDPLLLPISDE
ncbi:MAG: peptidylprolyl isomerase [Gammaproteobacteria bacterium]|nr:peptidylprolyl isomerase [Gammaproteobacteria bacterium]